MTVLNDKTKCKNTDDEVSYLFNSCPNAIYA